ncbi:MAG: TonB-dependent receptor [Steroidobacteraceae bacterium]|nr:TonB-dependent receptor [Steroidobacteraceae bacterium]
MTRNTEIARSIRRALFMSACAAGGVSTAFAQDAPPNDSDATDQDTVVVTGSRIVSPNLLSISPVTSLSAEEIVRTGRSSIEDVINELPQVFAAQGANVSNASNGTATVNLRGLGSNRTLVLLNGRRLGPGDPGSTTFASDINIVPTMLVSRVEILTGGASSVYGADAVGGVINFITDKKFEGVKISGGYSFYNHKNDNDAAQEVLEAGGIEIPEGTVNKGYDKNFSFAVGSNFSEDRGNATFYATYRDTDPVFQADYDYSACTYFSGAEFECGGSGTSFPARFRPINPLTGVVATNVLTDPMSGNQSYTINGGGAFAPGNAAAYNFGPLNYYQRPNKRYTVGSFLNFVLTEKAEVYGEFNFLKDQSVSQIAPSGLFTLDATVSCANPLWTAAQFTAFCGQFGLGGAGGVQDPTTTDTTTIRFNRRNIEGGGRQQDLEHSAYRAGGGVKGAINDAWSYDASLFQGTARISNTYLNDFSISRSGRALNVVPGPGGVPTCASVIDGTDATCIPYNIWAADSVDAAALNYVQIPLVSVGEVTERVLNSTFTVDLGQYGLKLAAEDGILVNFGVEMREVETDFQPDGNYISGDGAGQGGATLPLSGSFRAKEAFFEARIPILDNLSAETGYRFSDYSGAFDTSTDTYKFGLEYSPIEAIRVRGSFQHATRVPNIYELFGTNQVGLNGTLDPCAGDDPVLTQAQCANTGLTAAQYGAIEANPAAQYNGFIGGNPNLEPEDADTLSFGIEFHPDFAPGLRVNLDWYSIKVDKAIQNPNQDFTLLQCALTGDAALCGQVNRDGGGSLFETNDGFVIDTLQNIGSIETSGVDIDASYGFEIGGAGKLRFGVVGTYLDSYEVTPQDGITYDCVGLYGSICTSGTPNGAPVAEWRHKMDATWTTPWSGIDLNLGWRYYGESKRDLESPQESLAFLGLATGVFESDSVLGSRSYIDFSASVTVMEKYTVRLGANNLFDKDPPLNGSNTCPTGPCNGNTWPQAYDALGRQVFLSIGAEF